jgi:hypothetical protein
MKVTLTSGHTITISEGNSKMGKVYSFSVSPVVTCAANVPCAKACYACKLCRIYANVKSSYAANWDAVQNANMAELAAALVDVIKAKKVKLFRFNVSGDFKDPMYLRVALTVAAACPDTQFLAFTKVYTAFAADRPENFNLFASVWNDYAPADIDAVPSAHYCDGSRPMPADAVECGGNCEECGLCFNLKPGEKVFFKKH